MIKRPILYDIKIATGIAILLVVIGHLASRGQEGIDFYVKIKMFIYKFHMPLFLFLSGYISGYTYKEIITFSQYTRHIKRKFFRLFPAYILLSLIFFLGKYTLGSGTSLLDGLLSILFYPSIGNSGFLWYIYVLFLYNLILSFLMRTVMNYFLLLFTISIILSFITFPILFSLNFFFWYLPYFICGCFLSKNISEYNNFLKKNGFKALFAFLLLFVLEFAGILNLHKNIVSFFAIIAIHFVSLKFSEKRNMFFEFLGDNSFNIYLFNTLFIGGITFLLKKIIGSELFFEQFYLITPLMISSGLFLPIILYRILKKYLPEIAKYLK